LGSVASLSKKAFGYGVTLSLGSACLVVHTEIALSALGEKYFLEVFLA
jgi:hypothetical protein